MNKLVLQAMVAASLISSTEVDPAIAAQLLDAFFSARGQTTPEDDAEIIKGLKTRMTVGVPPGTTEALAQTPLPAGDAEATRAAATQIAGEPIRLQPESSDSRSQDIMAAVRLAALPADRDRLALAQQLIDARDGEGNPLSVSAALRQLQNLESEATQPASATTTVTVQEDSRERFHAAARDQLLSREWSGDSGQFGNSPEQVWDYRARQYRDYQAPAPNYGLQSLLGVARECLRMSGVPHIQIQRLANTDIARLVMGANPWDMGINAASDGPAFNLTGMFSNILFDAQNVVLRRSYDDSRTTFQTAFRRNEDIPDFKPTHASIAGQLGDPRAVPEDGEFEETTMTDEKEQYQLHVWGQIWSQSWQSVVNDRLGAFTEIPRKMGEAMRRKLNRLAWGVILDNGNLQDGTALFHADHTNLTTGAGKKPNDTTEVSTLYKKMMEQKGIGTDASTLNLEARQMWVPPALRTEAVELRRSIAPPTAGGSNAGSSGVSNVFEQTFDVVVESELGAASSNSNGSDTAWYLSADPRTVDTVVYAFLQGLTSPAFEREMSFSSLAMRERCYLAFAVKALDFRGLQKHTGAA